MASSGSLGRNLPVPVRRIETLFVRYHHLHDFNQGLPFKDFKLFTKKERFEKEVVEEYIGFTDKPRQRLLWPSAGFSLGFRESLRIAAQRVLDGRSKVRSPNGPKFLADFGLFYGAEEGLSHAIRYCMEKSLGQNPAWFQEKNSEFAFFGEMMRKLWGIVQANLMLQKRIRSSGPPFEQRAFFTSLSALQLRRAQFTGIREDLKYKMLPSPIKIISHLTNWSFPEGSLPPNHGIWEIIDRANFAWALEVLIRHHSAGVISRLFTPQSQPEKFLEKIERQNKRLLRMTTHPLELVAQALDS